MVLEIDCCKKIYREENKNRGRDRENNSGGPFLPPIPISIAVVGDFKRDHMMRAAKNMVFSLTVAQPWTRDEFVRQVHARCIHHEAEETPIEKCTGSEQVD